VSDKSHSTNGHVLTESLDASAGRSPLVIETRGLTKTYVGKFAVPVLHGDIHLTRDSVKTAIVT
jgi:hypothetical protein